MIELKISGKCQGCPALEINVGKLYYGGDLFETAVSCQNARLCEHLEKFIESRLLAADQADKK